LAEKYFSNLVAALGLGFLLGAAVMQKPAGRRRPGEPGLLQRATRLLAQLTPEFARSIEQVRNQKR
jgi:hypothetical protein